MRRLANHVGLMTTGILVAGLAFAQIPEPGINALLAKAATYVRRFEQEFRTVVGQEHYEQRWSGFSPDLDASSRRQRTIESETLFLWLPEETSWLTVRNAHAVDGLPVPDSETRLERGEWHALGVLQDQLRMKRRYLSPVGHLTFNTYPLRVY